jgi:hypothetical protein
VTAKLIILAAAGLALAACAPETEAPRAPEAEPVTEPAETPAETPDGALRAYLEANFSGRWGVDASCPEEGMFHLSADQFTLYERRCEVFNLICDGAMIAARTRCTEEGQPMAENTHTLSPVSDGTITVSDGHYEWTRVRCGEAQ